MVSALGSRYACARELFEAARAASRDAEVIGRQLEAMGERALSLGGGGAGEQVSSTPDPHRMEGRVAALVDREREMLARQERDYAVIDLACRVLYGHGGEAGLSSLVPAWWCDVLWWRYLGCASWDRVGSAVGYSAHRCWEVAQTAMEVCDGWGLVSVMAGRGMAEG